MGVGIQTGKMSVGLRPLLPAAVLIRGVWGMLAQKVLRFLVLRDKFSGIWETISNELLLCEYLLRQQIHC